MKLQVPFRYGWKKTQGVGLFGETFYWEDFAGRRGITSSRRLRRKSKSLQKQIKLCRKYKFKKWNDHVKRILGDKSYSHKKIPKLTNK